MYINAIHNYNMVYLIFQVVLLQWESEGLTQDLKNGKMSEVSKDTDLLCRHNII